MACHDLQETIEDTAGNGIPLITHPFCPSAIETHLNADRG